MNTIGDEEMVFVYELESATNFESSEVRKRQKIEFDRFSFAHQCSMDHSVKWIIAERG